LSAATTQSKCGKDLSDEARATQMQVQLPDICGAVDKFDKTLDFMLSTGRNKVPATKIFACTLKEGAARFRPTGLVKSFNSIFAPDQEMHQDADRSDARVQVVPFCLGFNGMDMTFRVLDRFRPWPRSPIQVGNWQRPQGLSQSVHGSP
jgi:hypothetical protein